MIRRSLLFLLALALPLVAADIPLSDRPLAPIPNVQAIAASASPNAVLVVFTTDRDVFAQRLAIDGSPIDAKATLVGSGVWPTASVVWSGSKWVILWGPSHTPKNITFFGPDGVIGEAVPHLDLPNLGRLAYTGDRVVMAASEAAGNSSLRLRIMELDADGDLVPISNIPVDWGYGPWLVAIDDIVAAVSANLNVGFPQSYARIGVHDSGGVMHEISLKVALPANLEFIASRSRGGLLVWNDGGLKGAILRSDGSFSPEFTIGPRGALSEGVVGTARDGGWDVLFEAGGAPYLGRISVAGEVAAQPLDHSIWRANWPGAFVAAGDAHLVPGVGTNGHLEIRRIVSGRVGDPITAGVGEAAQFKARSATAGDLDLVLWEEQGSPGRVLKATRVGRDGLPLDGPGLLIADGGLENPYDYYGARFDVAFDGETFVAVWIEEGSPDSVVTRRIRKDGVVSHPLVVASWEHIGGVGIAGGSGGRSAVSWIGMEALGLQRAVFAPIEGGRIGSIVDVTTGQNVENVPRIAASADRYLAVFNDYRPCNILCPPDGRIFARMFSFDGAPLSEVRQLSTMVGWDPSVVSDGGDFFVVWQDILVKVGSDFSIGPEIPLARDGTPSIEGAELRVDGGPVRAVYTLAGDIVRFEELAGEQPAEAAASLSGNRVIVSVPAGPQRLMIRSLDRETAVADLAIVGTGAISLPSDYGGTRVATFRVEHRGGADVSRVFLWSSDHWLTSTAVMINGEFRQLPLVLERELREGDSFEIAFTVRTNAAGPTLWVKGNGTDPIASNNGGRYELPSRSRGRTVTR